MSKKIYTSNYNQKDEDSSGYYPGNVYFTPDYQEEYDEGFQSNEFGSGYGNSYFQGQGIGEKYYHNKKWTKIRRKSNNLKTGINCMEMDSSKSILWVGNDNGYLQGFQYSPNEKKSYKQRNGNRNRKESLEIIRSMKPFNGKIKEIEMYDDKLLFALSKNSICSYNKKGIMKSFKKFPLVRNFTTLTNMYKSYNNSNFVIGQENENFMIYNPYRNNIQSIVNTNQGIMKFKAIESKDILFCGGNNGELLIRSLKNPSFDIVNPLKVHSSSIVDIAVDLNSNLFCTCGIKNSYGGRKQVDSVIKIFDMRTFKLLTSINSSIGGTGPSFLRFIRNDNAVLGMFNKYGFCQYKDLNEKFQEPSYRSNWNFNQSSSSSYVSQQPFCIKENYYNNSSSIIKDVVDSYNAETLFFADSNGYIHCWSTLKDRGGALHSPHHTLESNSKHSGKIFKPSRYQNQNWEINEDLHVSEYTSGEFKNIYDIPNYLPSNMSETLFSEELVPQRNTGFEYSSASQSNFGNRRNGHFLNFRRNSHFRTKEKNQKKLFQLPKRINPQILNQQNIRTKKINFSNHSKMHHKNSKNSNSIQQYIVLKTLRNPGIKNLNAKGIYVQPQPIFQTSFSSTSRSNNGLRKEGKGEDEKNSESIEKPVFPYIEITETKMKKENEVKKYQSIEEAKWIGNLKKLNIIDYEYRYHKFFEGFTSLPIHRRNRGHNGNADLLRQINNNKFIGLENTLNNSSLNCIIQLLLHLFPSRLKLTIINHLCMTENCLTCELSSLFTLMDNMLIQFSSSHSSHSSSTSSSSSHSRSCCSLGTRKSFNPTNLYRVFHRILNFHLNLFPQSALLSKIFPLSMFPNFNNFSTSKIRYLLSSPLYLLKFFIYQIDYELTRSFSSSSSSSSSSSGSGKDQKGKVSIMKKLFGSQNPVNKKCLNCGSLCELDETNYFFDFETKNFRANGRGHGGGYSSNSSRNSGGNGNRKQSKIKGKGGGNGNGNLMFPQIINNFFKNETKGGCKKCNNKTKSVPNILVLNFGGGREAGPSTDPKNPNEVSKNRNKNPNKTQGQGVDEQKYLKNQHLYNLTFSNFNDLETTLGKENKEREEKTMNNNNKNINEIRGTRGRLRGGGGREGNKKEKKSVPELILFRYNQKLKDYRIKCCYSSDHNIELSNSGTNIHGYKLQAMIVQIIDPFPSPLLSQQPSKPFQTPKSAQINDPKDANDTKEQENKETEESDLKIDHSNDHFITFVNCQESDTTYKSFEGKGNNNNNNNNNNNKKNQKNSSVLQSKNEANEMNWYLFNDQKVIKCKPKHGIFDFSNSKNWKRLVSLIYVKTNLKNQFIQQDKASGVSKSGILRYKNPVFRLLPKLNLLSLLKYYEEKKEKKKEKELFALDAEFIILKTSENARTKFSTLGRVSVLKENGEMKKGKEKKELETMIDNFIQVEKYETVSDYLTRYSGLYHGDLNKSIESIDPDKINGDDESKNDENIVSLKYNYLQLRALADSGVSIVGHGLETDFRKLNIIIPLNQVKDTVKIFRRIGSRFISLKFLTFYLLGELIQEKTHCSYEDALSSLELFKLYESLNQSQFIQLLQAIYALGNQLGWKIDKNYKFALQKYLK